jgi:hypothetical protein
MCALIDSCVLSKVFNKDDAEHKPFKDISRWISEGSGAIVYGGSTYAKQLGTGRYLELFSKLRVAGRAFPVDGNAVDKREKLLKKLIPDKDFDDPHLIAIIGLSKCCILCTTDVRFRPYFKRKDLYPQGVIIPKIYTEKQGKKHCSNSAVVGSCPRRPQPSRPGKKPKARQQVPILGS